MLVSLCAYFSENYKQDYEKLEELLKTLPNRTTHEVMVRLVSCFTPLDQLCIQHPPSVLSSYSSSYSSVGAVCLGI